MKNRFDGDFGKQELCREIRKHGLVGGDDELAQALVRVGEVIDFKDKQTILEQGDESTEVYFIVSGEIGVYVNHHFIGTRGPGEVVGEMVAVSPSSCRAATLVALGAVTALVVNAEVFIQLGSGSVEFWRYLAELAGNRLRERAKFHLPANNKPILFIGSSAEGSDIAKEIQAGLDHDDMVVRPWLSRGVFEASSYAVDDLMKQVREADFALFVFGADDATKSRRVKYMSPRDNVVFEMGMFIARLGRSRVFMVQDRTMPIKIPTDLLGMNSLSYEVKLPGGLPEALGPVCHSLAKMVRAQGVHRQRMQVE